MRRAPRLAHKCSRKTYAECASNACSYGYPGDIQMILDDLSLPPKGHS